MISTVWEMFQDGHCKLCGAVVQPGIWIYDADYTYVETQSLHFQWHLRGQR